MVSYYHTSADSTNLHVHKSDLKTQAAKYGGVRLSYKF